MHLEIEFFEIIFRGLYMTFKFSNKIEEKKEKKTSNLFRFVWRFFSC